MKRSLKLLVLALFISNFSSSQSITSKIDSLVLENYKSNPDVSISVGFIHNNEEYYTAYGKIDKESKVDINKNSIFEIASITKILTANLIAQAVIEHKIRLDDFIEKHLPKDYVLHNNLKNKITISDLASHQSGLADIDFGKLIAKNPQMPMEGVTNQTFIDIMNNCTELIDYGKYRYSTIGFMLLGQILENVYEKSYDEIIREKMITPFQLTNTLTTDFNVKNIVTGYNPNGGTQALFKWQAGASAGLVKSSASDMITFLKAVLNNGNAISEAALMTEKVFYRAKNNQRKIGLGINIYIDDENTFYLKTGDSMGQSSILCYNRIDKWGYIILINQRNSKIRRELSQTIYETVLKGIDQ